MSPSRNRRQCASLEKEAGEARPAERPEDSFRNQIKFLTHQFGAWTDEHTSASALAELKALPGAVEAVCAQLHDGNSDDQAAAANALGLLQTNPEMSIPILEWALNEGVAPGPAAEALVRFGAVGLVPVLKAAQREKASCRCAAIAAMKLLSNRPDEVVAMLSEALSDPSESIRMEAVQALGFMRTRSVQALPALLAAKGREDGSWLGFYISCALSWIVPSAARKLIDELKNADAGVRKHAAQHFPDAIGMTKESVELLAKIGCNDSSEQVRMSALLALEQIGLRAGEGLATVMAALEKAQQSQIQAEVRTRSMFAKERIRDAIGQFANVPRARLKVAPLHGNKRRPKRGADEPSKGLLALLNALVKWGDLPISGRKLPTSPRLQDERRALGLPVEVSASTVGYQLAFLARLCGESSVLETYNQRQASRFRPGVRAKLQIVQGHLAPFILAGATLDALAAQKLPFDRSP